LTKKSANPQDLIDAVRQGVLEEVDAHPPFRSLLEHKAYLKSWLPTVCSHVDFRHGVFLLGDTLRDSWLFFEFVPAAPKAVESRRSHSAAEAQASSSSRRRQDFPDSQYHGEERHRSPPGGYAQRKIEEAPSEDSHYQEKIIWRSVQHGFKLRRD